MENFIFSVQVVAPLFLLIAGGYAGAYFKFLSPNFLKEANKFVFNFSLPFLLYRSVFSAVHKGDVNPYLISTCLTTITVMIVVLCLLVPLFVKRNGQRGSMIQAIYRSNFLIYGIPLGISMYGQAAMAPISMIMAVSIPYYNISAVLILSFFSEEKTGKLQVKQFMIDVFKNPLIIACVIGSIFGYFHWELPNSIDNTVKMIGDIATPLALIVMGGQFKFRSLHKNIKMVISASVLRLIIIPALAIATFVYLGFRGVELCALFCLFATPTAVASYIMSENMGCDGQLSGQIIVLTTIISSFTIFGFIFFMRSMGFL